MKEIDSPVLLARRLVELFPSFAAEFEAEELKSYHQVIQCLTPVITGYLQDAPERTTKQFCDLINEMAEAGGEKENAISTCLLEHASQIRIQKIIRPHLGAAAKRELR
jgi:hypothetical protein